jgi:hypothetical protein
VADWSAVADHHFARVVLALTFGWVDGVWASSADQWSALLAFSSMKLLLQG